MFVHILATIAILAVAFVAFVAAVSANGFLLNKEFDNAAVSLWVFQSIVLVWLIVITLM